MRYTKQGGTYDMSPYPTVVIVTTAHQKPSGMDLKLECEDPASAKYTLLEKSTTPVVNIVKGIGPVIGSQPTYE